jgi:hypothetical protein
VIYAWGADNSSLLLVQQLNIAIPSYHPMVKISIRMRKSSSN